MIFRISMKTAQDEKSAWAQFYESPFLDEKFSNNFKLGKFRPIFHSKKHNVK
jgi:hypothetical protein